MSARFITLSLAFLAVLCALNVSSAATIRERSLNVDDESNTRFQARQSYSSEEGSDEDSDESDAEQAAQQAYAQAQRYQEESEEESDEDQDDFNDDDGENDARKRRQVMSTAEKVPAETVTQVATPATEGSIKNEQESITSAVAVTPVTPTVSAVPQTTSSVLILLRDTLKKVTNDLPTQQYASNALQYFQLFEHFLQETIEQVISGDDDDDDEETSNNKTEIEVEVAEAVTKAPVTVQTAEAVGETAHVTEVVEEQKKPIETSEPVSAPMVVPIVAPIVVPTVAPTLVPTVAPPIEAMDSISTKATFV